MSVLQGTVFPAKYTAAGDLAGNTVTVTVTAPDGSTSTPTVTVSGSTATANVPASLVGTYLLVWSVTGPLADGVQDQLTVKAARIELMSVGDLRDKLNLADTSKDPKLRDWLTAAGDLIENVTGPIRAQTLTDTFDGGTEYVVLRAPWVSAITRVTETWGTALQTLTEQPLGSSVDAYGYTWNRLLNTVTRRTYGGGVYRFATGREAVQVTYVAGLAQIPGDIQEACARLISHWYRKSETAFRSTSFSAVAADDAVNLPGNYMLPNEVMELLEPWRRPPGIA